MATSNKLEDFTTLSSAEEKLKTMDEKKMDEKESAYNIDNDSLDSESRPVYHNGEPIIKSGLDVSRFVVNIRDDEDPALTFRSIVLGTLFAGLGAALSQVSN